MCSSSSREKFSKAIINLFNFFQNVSLYSLSSFWSPFSFYPFGIQAYDLQNHVDYLIDGAARFPWSNCNVQFHEDK